MARFASVRLEAQVAVEVAFGQILSVSRLRTACSRRTRVTVHNISVVATM
jgi:hypothetical protein